MSVYRTIGPLGSLSTQNIHRRFMLEWLHFYPFFRSERDQNINVWYTLEVTSTNKHCFGEEMRNKVYSSKSQFNYYIYISGV